MRHSLYLLCALLLLLNSCYRDKAYTDYTAKQQTALSLKGECLKGKTELLSPQTGAIVMMLNDGTHVDTRPAEDGWQLVSLFVAITPQQAHDFVIPPGVTLKNVDGDVLGKTIDSVYIWYAWDAVGVIGGYTEMEHINPETVSENILSNLLAEGKLNKNELHKALNYSGTQTNYADSSGIVTEIYTEENITLEPPVMERIALLFNAHDTLIAIVHSRELNTPQYTTYRFENNYLLTVTTDLTKEQLDRVVEARYEKFVKAQAEADRQREK